MYSIASIAGREWPKRISDAASYLSGGADDTLASIGGPVEEPPKVFVLSYVV
jgi:hypothetical protein